MESLLETIRAAIASGASTEQKAAGVQACRTIAAALDSEPGKPIALPGTPSAFAPAAPPSLDQVLDMMIAKLTAVASERDKSVAPALPPPNGLRVPVMRAAVPPAVRRSAIKPTAAPKAPNAPMTRKP